jgi:N-acetylglucosaminyldiphosphoundecaprenol N-acetyl-beta-D-mannosaminyltransferase
MDQILKVSTLLQRLSNNGFDSIINFYHESIKHKKQGSINYFNIHSLNIALTGKLEKGIWESFDLTHPDGIGIWLISKFLKSPLPFSRFNWTDNVYKFLEIAELNKWRIFFLGGKPDIILEAYKLTHKSYKSLVICGYNDGYSPIDDNQFIERINELKPDIIWVGMGTPKQEEWILKHKDFLSCYVLHAVGDIFSELAKVKVRGPKLFRQFGFEWIFRILSDPHNYLLRYFNSIILLMKIAFISLSSRVRSFYKFIHNRII